MLDLAGWLHQGGIPVTAAFFYDRDGLLPGWQANHPFPIISLNAWSKTGDPFTKAFKVIAGWIRLIKFMKKEHFSAVLTFTHDSDILGLPAAWIAGIPLRFGSHHGSPDFAPWKFVLHRKIINSKIASGLVAVSGFTRDMAINEGIKPGRIRIINNGISFHPRPAPNPGTVRNTFLPDGKGLLVLAVGRLVQPKGHVHFVEAAAQVLKSIPDVKFIIAGEGPLRKEIQRAIDKLGVSDNVLLLGNRTDISALLEACDVFVLSSLYEGLSMALLEAMAAGVPVVSTEIAGVADLIEGGVTGLLAPPGDSNALAEALCTVLADNELRTRLALNGKTLVEEKFTLDHMGQQYLELLGARNGDNLA